MILADFKGPPTEPVLYSYIKAYDIITEILAAVKWVSLACCVFALVVFGAMYILDKDRGQPISAVAPYVNAVKIALGAITISGASAIAQFFLQ